MKILGKLFWNDFKNINVYKYKIEFRVFSMVFVWLWCENLRCYDLVCFSFL